MKHFLVVGGTRGIGWTLAEKIADQGDFVSVFGRHIENNNNKILQYEVDVLDKNKLFSCIDLAIKMYGPISHAVFLQRNRGGDFKTQFDVSVSSTRTIIERLTTLESVVVVSSIADIYIATEQDEGYHVSKAGLHQLARYYSVKRAPARFNIVSPCAVSKEQKVPEKYAECIPLGRMGNPEDIANAILFLSSEKASYITGQNLVVDGGLTLKSHESILRAL